MTTTRVFTSESVSEGHPDKIADQISDAILDAILEQDTSARVACETLVKTGMVVLAGEITTSAQIEFEGLVRNTVNEIGYNNSDVGFDGNNCAVINALGKQSPDIAQGVDRASKEGQGAGDQGMMFGYASNETDVLMPAPITYAHRLVKKQSDVRKSGGLAWLRPDGIGTMLDLLHPIYQATAAYGHFGRDEESFRWERTDKITELKERSQ